VLVTLLGCGPDSELTEFSAAVLGNLAAGRQPLKSAIRQARYIFPLSSQLASHKIVQPLACMRLLASVPSLLSVL
jgi:hypothetical protein